MLRNTMMLSILMLFLYIPSMAQLSPNSASIANLSAATTGPYTGKPNINVPITALQGKKISIPISLSYNATGVRVEDVGSWVGLGWNLNVGGAITRTVRGADDFHSAGYFSGATHSGVPAGVPTNINSTCDQSATDYEEYLKDLIDGSQDAEPDLYNLSFPGFSAQFFFDQSGNPYTVPRQKIKIEKPTSANEEWTVTNTNGYVYTFGGTGFNETSGVVVNAWYLKEIKTPFGESVNFFYTPHTTSYSLLPSELYRFSQFSNCSGAGQGEDEALTFNRNVSVSSLFLDRIEVGNSKVQFYLDERCDINGKKLDRIVLSESGNTVNEYHFDFLCDPVKQRLWLTSLRTVNKDNKSLPPHRFEYNDLGALPGIRSFAQDHWGYYNGISNSQLTPTHIDGNFVFVGADRTANNNALKGLLKKVHFPFGGYTDYTFESNVSDNYLEQYPPVREASRSPTAEIPFPGTGGETFTLDVETLVSFTYTLNQNGGPVSTGDHYVRLNHGGGGATIFTVHGSSGNTTSTYPSQLLGPGTYDLIASIDSGSPYEASITASYTALELDPTSPTYITGGGVRIGKITTNDGINNSSDMVQTFDYSSYTSNSITSGKMMSGPVYEYMIKSWCANGEYTNYKVLGSSSSIPLSSSASGAYVGYTNVTVFNEDGDDEGKTEYTYHNNADAFITVNTNAFGNQILPYAPTTGDWYENGLLQLKEDYRRYSGQFYLQSSESPTYVFTDELSTTALVIADEVIYYQKCGDLFLGYYDTKTAWVQLESLYTTQYDGDAASVGNAISQTVNYSYDATEPWQMVKQETTNSDGVTFITELKYPNHFSPSVANDFSQTVGDMRDDYILAPVIQQISKRKEGSTTYVTGANITEWGAFNEGTQGEGYLPRKVHSLEISSPVTDYAFDSVSPFADTRMKEQISYTHDDDGNVTQTTRIAQSSSAIYGYDDDLPMASVANATTNEVAYTSFETSDSGYWLYDQQYEVGNDGYTGSRSFSSGTGTISRTGLTSGNYIVSVWAKGSGSVTVGGMSKTVTADWSQLSWQLFGVNAATISMNSTAKVDEVRLHPIDAMMTSYTYDPAIGVTSAAGASGKASFTEYDEFNRVSVVKDFRRQIVSTRDYSLRGKLYGDITAPTTVDLNASSDWSITLGEDLPPGITCTWDFGDGTAAQVGDSVSHTYTKLGYFDIEVSLSKNGYVTQVERVQVDVDGLLQGTISNGTGSPDTPFNLSVTNTSANPAGTTYTWVLEDTPAPGAMVGTSVSHTYNRMGIYNVQLTINHADYPARVINKSITIGGNLHTSITNGPPTLVEDANGTFAAATENNPLDATYTWSFGNTGSNVSRSFSSPTEGGSPISVTVTVSHPSFSPSHTSAPHNLTITYAPITATFSRNNNGSVAITVTNGQGDFKYEWRTRPGLTPWEEVWLVDTRSARTFTTPAYDPEIFSIEVRVSDTGTLGEQNTVTYPVFGAVTPTN
ncbi:MAG: PKD domain-containing protein [Cyclobacteriaceae bacterium]